ncbi:MAG: bifunctional UDP-N-acetylglucosamine diphosphorylase/glucosamine-1-phosphate N-acetyltransferase GlmU [Pseudomonadota bacterium]
MNATTTQSRKAAVVILAAGKGTRMKSNLPKVLHKIGNAPMLHHAMRTAEALSPDRIVVVVGHGADAVKAAAQAVAPDVRIAVQEQQNGTGHAVLAAQPELADFDGDLFVLFGDTPFIHPDSLLRMKAERDVSDIVALGFHTDTPAGYGRFIMGDQDHLLEIVESRDLQPHHGSPKTCNSGLKAGDCQTVLHLLGKATPQNAQGEIYLTDLIKLGTDDGLTCRAVFCDEAETLGINDRVQLAGAEAIFQTAARRDAMLGGATLTAPETVFFSMDTVLGQDVIVGPNVVFGPGVKVGDGCIIKAFCHLEQTTMAERAEIGPFARARGGTELAAGVKIGNFVEMKNAQLGPGTKAGHLSYLGDAVLGSGVNIGAGTITCNYDGVSKHKTTIGDDAFIGVNTALVAPVDVADKGFTATGTVVTKNVPADTMAIGRANQENKKPGSASRYLDNKRSEAEAERETK